MTIWKQSANPKALPRQTSIVICVFFCVWLLTSGYIPGMVAWFGGVEKAGRGEDESSVQLFNKWRNSNALENSLKNKQKNMLQWLIQHQWKANSQDCYIYPESFLYLSAMESLCGWMRVWTARSKSFLQKQRCSWAMGSTRTTLRQGWIQTNNIKKSRTFWQKQAKYIFDYNKS